MKALASLQLKLWAIAFAAGVLVVSANVEGLGQCSVHPEGRTALRFSNESRYELTFFVNDDMTGQVIRSGQIGPEREVPPGEHLLRARAILERQELWVVSWNEVPAGNLCVWTIEDPKQTVSGWGRRRKE
jgi:hypothetical protein